MQNVHNVYITCLAMACQSWLFRSLSSLSSLLASQTLTRWRAWTPSACRPSPSLMAPRHTSSTTPRPPSLTDRSWTARWSSWRMARPPTSSTCPCLKQVGFTMRHWHWYCYCFSVTDFPWMLTLVCRRRRLAARGWTGSPARRWNHRLHPHTQR